MKSESKWAIVTGGSGGIGWELSRLLANDGYNLVLVAQDSTKLKKSAVILKNDFGISAIDIALDLCQPSSAGEIFQRIEQENIKIDVLINNAGFGAFGNFWQISLERQLDMIQINDYSLTKLTGLVLPSMIKRGSGRILNVASTAAFQPGPLMAVYYASKAYVLSFSEALSNELKGTGISVSALCPGPTPTMFQERAGNSKSKLLNNWMITDASMVAKAGYQGMLKGKQVIIPGILNKIMALSVRFSPRKSVTAVTRWIQETRR